MKKHPQDNENDLDNKIQDYMFETQKPNALDNKFDKRAHEHFHCSCDLCQYEKPLQVPQRIILFSGRSSKSSINNNVPQFEKDFVYIIKRLQQPNKLVRGLRLNIPEMFFLIQGEIKYVAHVGKEKLEKREILTLKVSKQKEKLSLPYLRKFLMERRNRAKVNQAQEQISMRNSMIFSPTDTNNPNSNHASQFMDYQEQIKWQESRSREAIIIKYDDNNVQVLTENECFQLMMKRKKDPIWNSIQYIQNYVQPKKLNFELLLINFDYQQTIENISFKRALKEISYLNGDISKASEDYLSLEQEEDFERQLFQTAPRLFCQYAKYLDKVEYYLVPSNFNKTVMTNEHLNAFELNNRPFFDIEAVNKKKNNKQLYLKEELEDKHKFEDLMRIQRQYAATIYEDLMILEGQVKKHGDSQDMLTKNVLAVAGQDISNKRLMLVFKDNLSQFSQTIKPIDTLKQIVFSHKVVQEKRLKLMQIKPLFATKSSLKFKKSLFNINLVSNFSKLKFKQTLTPNKGDHQIKQIDQ